MGFLLGLFVGGMVLGSDGSAPSSVLGSIPLRCLYAFEVSTADYVRCRAVSLYRELRTEPTQCDRMTMQREQGECSLKLHLEWEIRALAMLKAQAQAKAKP